MRSFACLALVLALAACGLGDGGVSRNQIRVVGSSTVYPFTTAVAEQFLRKNQQYKTPIVEATGTGAGIKLFCQGVGARFPDIANASRRIKASELKECAANGVDEIVEIQVGIDGLALAESRQGDSIALTPATVYKALAARPYGKPQTARTWADVDPALPAIAIQVYGPPPTSGTRDALVELILQKGCDADPAMKALRDRDPDAEKSICTKIREDGAFIEAGENDNLIIQKLIANPDAVGIFGYASVEENADRVRGLTLSGVTPSYETISDFSYPGARPLYIYVKAAHIAAVPGLKAFVAEYASAWNPGSYLARRGMIPSPAPTRAANVATARDLTPLDPASVG